MPRRVHDALYLQEAGCEGRGEAARRFLDKLHGMMLLALTLTLTPTLTLTLTLTLPLALTRHDAAREQASPRPPHPRSRRAAAANLGGRGGRGAASLERASLRRRRRWGGRRCGG